MESVYAFIKECETYYLATVEGDQARVFAEVRSDSVNVIFQLAL